jgi:outer membrane protein assembly factor BamD
MKRKITVIYIVLCTFLLMVTMSCSKGTLSENPGFEKSFRKAVKDFEKENYREAIDGFRTILLNFSGENGIDSVRFLIAKSHYGLAEYYSASYEFLRLTENYPESRLVEDSFFLDAECYRMLSPNHTLDQSETRKALLKYQTYLDLYPRGKYSGEADRFIAELREKMARKEYEAGVLYMRMEQPRAAKVYFSQIIENYYDTKYYELSLEKISEAFLSMGDEYNQKIYSAKLLEVRQKSKE